MTFEKENLYIDIQKVLDYMSLEKTGWTDSARKKSLEVRREKAKSNDLDLRVDQGYKFKGGAKYVLTGPFGRRRWKKVGADIEDKGKEKKVVEAPVVEKKPNVKEMPQVVKRPSALGEVKKVPSKKLPTATRVGVEKKPAKVEDMSVEIAQKNLNEHLSKVQDILKTHPNLTAAPIVMHTFSEPIPAGKTWGHGLLNMLNGVQSFLSNGLKNFGEFSSKFPNLADKNWLKSMSQAVGGQQEKGNSVESTATPMGVVKSVASYQTPDAGKIFKHTKIEKIDTKATVKDEEIYSANTINGVLRTEFGVSGKRLSEKDIKVGKRFITYTITPSTGESTHTYMDREKFLDRFVEKLGYDETQNGMASARIVRPLRGGSPKVQIMFPRKHPRPVYFGDIAKSATFRADNSKIPVVFGEGPNGKIHKADLSKVGHMLIAGKTGSGKTVFVHNLINGILAKKKPSDVQLTMIDLKGTELTRYNGIPHLASGVITQPEAALAKLQTLTRDLNARFQVLSKLGYSSLDKFNSEIDATNKKHGSDIKKIPNQVVVIDELADLLLDPEYRNEAEKAIGDLARKGRAGGISLVLATQNPKREMLSGLIKTNIPNRVSFYVPETYDSDVILGKEVSPKANELSKNPGDAYYVGAGSRYATRVQAPYASEKDTEKFVSKIRNQTSIPQEGQLI